MRSIRNLYAFFLGLRDGVRFSSESGRTWTGYPWRNEAYDRGLNLADWLTDAPHR